MRYVCVTLVGGHKLYSKELFFKYLLALNNLPNEIWVASTERIFKEFTEKIDSPVPILHIQGSSDTGDDRIHSTTSARETLRQRIVESNYDWSLWLDNDILVPPDLVEKFQTILRRQPDLLMINAFHPARQDDTKVRHGLGSSFISKELLQAYPFTMATIREKDLGDDYIWKMVISQFSNRDLPIYSGYYFNVKHLTSDGRIKEFDEDIKRQLP